MSQHVVFLIGVILLALTVVGWYLIAEWHGRRNHSRSEVVQRYYETAQKNELLQLNITELQDTITKWQGMHRDLNQALRQFETDMDAIEQGRTEQEEGYHAQILSLQERVHDLNVRYQVSMAQREALKEELEVHRERCLPRLSGLLETSSPV